MKSNDKLIIALIYTVVLFLDRLDATIVNITLPTLAHYFGISIIATDWISLAFLLALAISIPISAWLGDRFGLKKIYIIAMLLFGAGSTLCVFATSLNQLILLRFIQGIGGGLLIPVGMTLVYQAHDKRDYARITSFTFIPSLIAPAIAPFLGGVILETFGWREVFLFSGPIALLLAFASMGLLREAPHKNKYPFDYLGFILSSVILIDVFYSLSLISRHGLSVSVLFFLGALIPLIGLFIKVETIKTYPLMGLALFKNSLFVRANLIQLCFQICHFGAIFLVGLFLQVGVGFSAILAGLMMGMQAVGAMFSVPYSTKLFNRYGPKLPLVTGLMGIAILSPMILLINKPSLFTFGMLLFWVRGLFSGLCGTPIQTLSIMGFDKQALGSVNSIFNVSRQVSISLGVALSSLLIAGGLHFAGLTGTTDIPLNKAFAVFGFGFWIIPVIALIGVAITWRLEQN